MHVALKVYYWDLFLPFLPGSGWILGGINYMWQHRVRF